MKRNRLRPWSAVGPVLILILIPLGLGREGPPARAQAPAAAPTAPAVPAAGVRRALVACGLPGDAEHRAMYAAATEKIARALVDRCGFRAEDVWVRFGDAATEADGPALKASRGLATRENLAADAEALRRASAPTDAVWVIVLGHGHFDGRRSHWNIPGPDLSDQEFGRLFVGIKAQEQVFFLTTSASGFFVRPLAGPGRVAISATEADQEVNETLYPLALADILAAPPAEADRDHDGALTLFELYLAVAADVAQRYATDELIATEHAQIEDNGDGRGSEVQLQFLPVGDAPAQGQPPAQPAPVLRPKDDGFLSSKIRVDRPAATPAAP